MTEAKKSMFGIVDDFEAVNRLIEEADGTSDESLRREADSVLDAFTKEILGDFGGKADNYARVVQAADNRAAAIKEEKKRLDGLQKAEERKVKRLKDILFYAMDTLGLDKYVTDLHTFTLAKDGGALPVEVSIDAKLLPDDYRVEELKVTADKVAIRWALAEGEEIEGCKLLERGRSLRIR